MQICNYLAIYIRMDFFLAIIFASYFTYRFFKNIIVKFVKRYKLIEIENCYKSTNYKDYAHFFLIYFVALLFDKNDK